LFNDRLYIMDSETTVKRSYAHLTMIVRPERRHLPIYDFLFEFKFVALTEAKLSGETARGLRQADVARLLAVQSQMIEALARLESCRPALQSKHQDRLHLRTYAVVALGFERLVWEEV
jgi:hypothetical protein